MLYTPAALELALRCPLTIPLSSGGEDDKPEMAESTLVRGSTVSADMIVMKFRYCGFSANLRETIDRRLKVRGTLMRQVRLMFRNENSDESEEGVAQLLRSGVLVS